MIETHQMHLVPVHKASVFQDRWYLYATPVRRPQTGLSAPQVDMARILNQ